MNQTVLDPFANLSPGAELGRSEWLRISQDMINRFGAATLDPDPMHIDPDWARRSSPFGGTIAFGFLTVSLLTHFIHDVIPSEFERDLAEHGYYLNYGFDKLRLVAPVREGSRVCGHFWLKERRKDEKGRFINCVKCEVEIEGEDRPALVAEWLSMWVPSEAA